MKLKKINENLQKALIENGLVEANAMQQETFSTLKSGADCLIVAPKGSGKTTTIVINVIQRLAGANEESPRALIVVEDKAKVLAMEELFDKYNQYTKLEVYGVHDKGDMDSRYPFQNRSSPAFLCPEIQCRAGVSLSVLLQ